ncbi:MAG: type II secretion system protein J [Opitutales bacterium]
MRPRATAAFSLPEMLVALTIFGFVSAAVLSTTLMLTRVLHAFEDSADYQRMSRAFGSYLSQDVRSAETVALSSSTRFTITTVEGATITYDLVELGGGTFRLERSAAGGTQRLLSPVVSWSVTTPSGTTPFSVDVVLARHDGRGQAYTSTLRRSFTARKL